VITLGHISMEVKMSPRVDEKRLRTQDWRWRTFKSQQSWTQDQRDLERVKFCDWIL
jgi:hypothetical protein